MGCKFCNPPKELDSLYLNIEKEIEKPSVSKTNNKIVVSAKIIQNHWISYREKLKAIDKLSLLLDDEIIKIGKFITDEEFYSKINQTVVLIENNKTFSNLVANKPLNKICFFKDPVMHVKGSCYRGDWNLNVKRHGYGEFINIDGSKYEGFWENNIIKGQGRLIDTSGGYYEGEWLNGKLNGKGIYVRIDGFTYKGDWCDDKQNGYGEEIYNNGSNYVGQFLNGKKNGKGKLHLLNYIIYEGEFFEDNFHGQGHIKWNDGNSYEGQWLLNKMHGEGFFLWHDGRKYIGEYTNDKKEGYGAYYWNPYKYYEGFWKDGKRVGPAKICINKKVKYSLFKNGNSERELEKDEFEKLFSIFKSSGNTNNNLIKESIFEKINEENKKISFENGH